MRPAHRRPKGASAPFGLALFILVMSGESIGYQDLAAAIARQPGVGDRWREHLIASPFGTIHAATFRFPRPVGTAIPDPFGIASSNRMFRSDPRRAIDLSSEFEERDFPIVDRTLKGDRISISAAKAATDPSAEATKPPEVQLVMLPPSAVPEVSAAAPGPRDSSDISAKADDVEEVGVPFGDLDGELAPFEPDGRIPSPEHDKGATSTAARFYLDIALLGAFGMMEPWTPGEGPILEPSDNAPSRGGGARLATIDLPGADQTIAPKGEVTGPDRTLKTPAERLGLTGKSRAKSEKCLADAVYFEARGESERGQMAVAQVVMNRVFSGYYPDNVCGVVYQNAHRRLACQFTFACDGIPDRVTEPEAWARAKRIARDTLDGKHWLPDVGKATHYHATWVHPYWVRAMKKLDKIGVHTFYRPRKWGDGADSPVWGDTADGKL
jgi:hypothetical protein